MRLILILVTALHLCCQTSTEKFSNTIQVGRIDSESKLLIGKVTNEYAGAFEYNPSMHSYHCFYDTLAGLVISFGWGTGTSGESGRIITKKRQFNISLDAGGCGLFDSYDFLTQLQILVLADTAFLDADTISGYIEYRGIQDTKGMKQRFEKNESDLKNNYGIELSYFDTLQPAGISIIGTFNLAKCNHANSSDTVYHKWILKEVNSTENGY